VSAAQTPVVSLQHAPEAGQGLGVQSDPSPKYVNPVLTQPELVLAEHTPVLLLQHAPVRLHPAAAGENEFRGEGVSN
jgi:hypothetical protein